MKKRLPILTAALFSLALSTFLSLAAPQPQILDVLGYFKDSSVWSKSPDSFIIENRPYGFQFLDAERTSAFSPEKGRMTFGRFYVYETRD